MPNCRATRGINNEVHAVLLDNVCAHYTEISSLTCRARQNKYSCLHPVKLFYSFANAVNYENDALN